MQFLSQLHRQVQRQLILVCDRWSVHRSAVRRLQQAGAKWLSVEWLPPYAPDLNPVEALWSHSEVQPPGQLRCRRRGSSVGCRDRSGRRRSFRTVAENFVLPRRSATLVTLHRPFAMQGSIVGREESWQSTLNKQSNPISNDWRMRNTKAGVGRISQWGGNMDQYEMTIEKPIRLSLVTANWKTATEKRTDIPSEDMAR